MPDQQEGLFGAFSSAATSTTEQFGSSGFGLSIGKRCIDMMGCEAGVACRPPAKQNRHRYGQALVFLGMFHL